MGNGTKYKEWGINTCKIEWGARGTIVQAVHGTKSKSGASTLAKFLAKSGASTLAK